MPDVIASEMEAMALLMEHRRTVYKLRPKPPPPGASGYTVAGRFLTHDCLRSLVHRGLVVRVLTNHFGNEYELRRLTR